MADDLYHVGMAWAADGESRPSRFRTVLARAPGAGDGALFVEDGDDSRRQWILASEWQAWVKETNAKLVPAVEESGDDDPHAA
jgi:hypothetical protein